MSEILGAFAIALLGLGTLLVGTLTVVGFSPIVLVTERLSALMPNFKIETLSDAEAEAAFKRTRGPEDVSEWEDMFRDAGISVGKVYRFPTEMVTVEVTQKDGTVRNEDVEYLTDSESEDDKNGISVRAAKRRFQTAAKNLGYILKWKQPDGYLIARVDATVATTTTTAEPEPEPEPSVVEPTPTTPTSIASAPASTGRRVVRR